MRWRLSSDRGWLSLSNEPERAAEAAAWRAEAGARAAAVRLHRDKLLILLARQRDPMNPDPMGVQRRIDIERSNLLAAYELLRAAESKPRTVTPPQGYSTPYAAAACALGFGPLSWLAVLALRWARRPRPRAGCCRVCGYDLRASPERCPECGTAVTPDTDVQLSRDEAPRQRFAPG